MMLGAMPDAMRDACDARMPDAMHERTDGLTYAETPHNTSRDQVEEGDAGARVVPGRLAYLKDCDGCGSEIFMAICRDGRWRPFETKRQTVPLPFAWAWRKHHGMEETDTVCGHFIHCCPDFHDRVFRFADNSAADRKAAG